MRAVVFDLGHTLIDYHNDWRVPEGRAIERFYHVLSVTVECPPTKELFIRHMTRELQRARTRRRTERIEIPLVQFLGDTLSDLGTRPTDDLIGKGVGIFYDALLEHRALIPGSLEMLRDLRQEGKLIGLISDVAWGLPSLYPLRDLEHYHLRQFFDDMVFSTDVGLRKPDRRIFEIAMENLGVVAGESVYVGNNLQADIAGALGVGMKAILKRSSYFSPDDSIIPTAAVDDWSELVAVLKRL